jgi:glycosyltransferase involved in cell wall biosynthesis
MRNKISIIIPTKNEEARLGNLLKSIRNAGFRGEVIVIDANSKDKTRYIAKKFRATVIDEKAPHSLPSARNQGIDASVGDAVLLLDADNEVTKNFFRKIGAMKDWDALRLIEIKAQDTFIEKLFAVRSFRSKYSAIPYLYKRHVLDRVKFDPSLGLREDKDFFSRVEKMNVKIKNCDAGIIIHTIHTFKELARQLHWYGRTSLIAFKKSRDPRIFSILVFLLLPFLFLQVHFWLKILSALIWLYEIYVIVRGGSILGLLFPIFDFVRSILFAFGMVESLLVKRVAR